MGNKKTKEPPATYSNALGYYYAYWNSAHRRAFPLWLRFRLFFTPRKIASDGGTFIAYKKLGGVTYVLREWSTYE